MILIQKFFMYEFRSNFIRLLLDTYVPFGTNCRKQKVILIHSGNTNEPNIEAISCHVGSCFRECQEEQVADHQKVPSSNAEPFWEKVMILRFPQISFYFMASIFTLRLGLQKPSEMPWAQRSSLYYLFSLKKSLLSHHYIAYHRTGPTLQYVQSISMNCSSRKSEKRSITFVCVNILYGHKYMLYARLYVFRNQNPYRLLHIFFILQLQLQLLLVVVVNVVRQLLL